MALALNTVVRQVGALLRRLRSAPGDVNACPSSPAEVTVALFACFVLSATLQLDFLYIVGAQLGGMRSALAALAAPFAAAFERPAAAAAAPGGGATDAAAEPDLRRRRRRALLLTLLFAYPVALFAFLIHAAGAFCSACRVPLAGPGCVMAPQHVLAGMAAALMLGLAEQSALLDELLSQLDAARALLRQLVPSPLAGLVEMAAMRRLTQEERAMVAAGGRRRRVSEPAVTRGLRSAVAGSQ
jgi:hypothetical protein